MKLLVGMDEYGNAFAYDVSTLDQFKDVILSWLKEDFRVLEGYETWKKPSYSEEELDSIPEELRSYALSRLGDYRHVMERPLKYPPIEAKILKAKTEEEVLEILEEHEGEVSDENLYIGSRFRPQIVGISTLK